jgi:hypothetical protein
VLLNWKERKKIIIKRERENNTDCIKGEGGVNKIFKTDFNHTTKTECERILFFI